MECSFPKVLNFLLNGIIITSTYVIWESFFQHHTPSANPLLTIKEMKFLYSASGLIHYHGESHLVTLIDSILQIPFPDKDLIIQLFTNLYLEDLKCWRAPVLTECCTIYHEAKYLHFKLENFFRKYGNHITITPSFVLSVSIL